MKKLQQYLSCIIILSGLIIGFISAPQIKAEGDYKEEKYIWNNETISIYENEENVKLFPVKKIVEHMGYTFEECSRCGKDEVYDPQDERVKEKGHYFVNWYQAILSYSVSDEMVELSAANEKFEGVTYGAADLFEAMGLKLSVDEKNKKIEVSSGKITAVYFYSSTCDTCEKMEEFISQMQKKYPLLNIKKYNIYEEQNYNLLLEYGKTYGLAEDRQGYSPSLYISDTVLFGEEIRQKLEENIENYSDGKATKIIENTDENASLENKSVFMQIISAFGFGLVNGINPCGLSMFLFLLSLLVAGKDKMLRCGFGFLAGKAIMFFLLGTIFYRIISRINMTAFSKWMDGILIVFVIVFAGLNLLDFFRARAENYEKMKLQLPKKLKNLNHRVLKWGNRFTMTKGAVIIMAGIGAVVASGEFLCTGQIYLSSIVMVVQNGTQGLYPMLLLAVYSLAFVIPLLVLMLVIYFGKKIFGMSEFVLGNISWIKLISAVLFIIMAVYIVLT